MEYVQSLQDDGNSLQNNIQGDIGQQQTQVQSEIVVQLSQEEIRQLHIYKPQTVVNLPHENFGQLQTHNQPQPDALLPGDIEQLQNQTQTVFQLPQRDIREAHVHPQTVVQIPQGDIRQVRAHPQTVVQIPQRDIRQAHVHPQTVVQITQADIRQDHVHPQTVVQIPQGDIRQDHAHPETVVQIPQGDIRQDHVQPQTVVQIPQGDIRQDNAQPQTVVQIPHGDIRQDRAPNQSQTEIKLSQTENQSLEKDVLLSLIDLQKVRVLEQHQHSNTKEDTKVHEFDGNLINRWNDDQSLQKGEHMCLEENCNSQSQYLTPQSCLKEIQHDKDNTSHKSSQNNVNIPVQFSSNFELNTLEFQEKQKEMLHNNDNSSAEIFETDEQSSQREIKILQEKKVELLHNNAICLVHKCDTCSCQLCKSAIGQCSSLEIQSTKEILKPKKIVAKFIAKKRVKPPVKKASKLKVSLKPSKKQKLTQEKIIECEICDIFEMSYDPIVGCFHSGIKQHQCDICEKWFHQKSHLNAHRLVHVGRKGGTKKQKRPQKIQIPKKIILSEIDLARCAICGKTFKTVELLQNHLLSHKERHECQTCGTGFKRKEHLLFHIRNHEKLLKTPTTQGPYSCAICRETFSSKKQFFTHQCREAHNHTLDNINILSEANTLERLAPSNGVTRAEEVMPSDEVTFVTEVTPSTEGTSLSKVTSSTNIGTTVCGENTPSVAAPYYQVTSLVEDTI